MVVELVLEPDPAPTIGAVGVSAAGGAAIPSGMTIGGVLDFSLSPLKAESNLGGQSTEVGGQLSVPPLSEESDPGGGHPEPAPKSPGVSQSARATPAGLTSRHPTSTSEATNRLTV
ncbi:hypothetical protein EV580_3785 [Mycobacterium sp. BK086]|nr:hypothetical protein EV580_3785 [Mycobacterium sp. BK086]